MKRWLIIGASVTAAILVVGVIVVWWSIGQPLYQPGKLANRSDLIPPPQTSSIDQWQVTEETSLYHFAVGEGRNVVLIHGGPGIPTTSSYPGLDGLSERYQFQYYDQRGCGNSSRIEVESWSTNTYENIQKLEGTLGIGAQLSDIERIRHILGDEKLIIIGHSYGALLATLYATEFPDHVSALVLISPADLLTLPSDNDGIFGAIRERLSDEDRKSFDKWLDNYLDLGQVFEKSNEELLAEDLDFAMYYRIASNSNFSEDLKTTQIGSWMIRAQFFSLGSRHDYREALMDVKAPVLIVLGADDLQPETVALFYSDALPNTETTMIDGAGHFPQIETPNEFHAAVSVFLSHVE